MKFSGARLRLCSGRTRLDPETTLYRGTALSDYALQLGNRAQHIIRVSSTAREVRDEKGKDDANGVLETVGFFTLAQESRVYRVKTAPCERLLLASFGNIRVPPCRAFACNQLLGPQPEFVLHRSSSYPNWLDVHGAHTFLTKSLLPGMRASQSVAWINY